MFADDCPRADSDEADERRLFYVALTRAEDYLTISSTGKSKFVAEIETAGADDRGEGVAASRAG
jgi:superfamily I DNA/RNA helicase